MKIALIAPPYPLEQAPSPPLGICYVASACEEAGFEVRIFDYIVRQYTPEGFIAELDDYQPDIVGSTAVTMNFLGAAEIIKTAKTHNPSIITMMGGPHVSFDFNNALNHYPEIDIIVIGEGEQTLKELLPVLTNKNCWPTIKGIAYRDNGKIVKTEERDFIQELDTLSFPKRDLLPMSRYLALGFPVSIITSRGCPNRCIFCLGRKMVGMKVRFRTATLILDEIEYLLSFGCTRINIADDFFTANKKRVKTFCEEILKRGIKFDWSAFARVDSVNRETLEIMKAAGCDSVSFGIESGNMDMLKRVRKGITPDQARKAVALCKEVGLIAHASFMVGLPGETKSSMNDTHKLAEELDIPYGYHFLAPFPGTVVREECRNYDIEILTDDWNLYDADRPVVKTSQLSTEEMEHFVDEFNKEIDDEFEEVKKRVKEGKGTDEEFFQVEGTRRMEVIFKLLSEGLVENCGVYQFEDILSDQVEQLAVNIAEVTNEEKIYIQKVITSLYNSGLLKYKQDKNEIQWFWTHNCKIDELDLT